MFRDGWDLMHGFELNTFLPCGISNPGAMAEFKNT